MNLIKSISRGNRDYWLYLRTMPAACITIILLAACSAYVFALQANNPVSLFQGTVLIGFGWASALLIWIRWNQQFASALRRAIFDHARTLSTQHDQELWYDSACVWFRVNHLLPDNLSWLFGFSVPWSLEQLNAVCERRATGQDHVEIAMYVGSDQGRDELRKLLDMREEEPSFFERSSSLDDFPLRWLTAGILVTTMLTVVVGVSPIPHECESQLKEKLRREALDPTSHDHSWSPFKPVRSKE